MFYKIVSVYVVNASSRKKTLSHLLFDLLDVHLRHSVNVSYFLFITGKVTQLFQTFLYFAELVKIALEL